MRNTYDIHNEKGLEGRKVSCITTIIEYKHPFFVIFQISKCHHLKMYMLKNACRERVQKSNPYLPAWGGKFMLINFFSYFVLIVYQDVHAGK